MVCESCSEIIFLDNNMPNWADIIGAITPSIIGLFSLLVAVATIFYTKNALKQQKEQWQKDVYIKREAEILLEFRNEFYDAQNSIIWFIHTLLNHLRYGNFTPTEVQRTIKIEDYWEHWDKINNLNNLYNKNQMIFKKHNIEEEFIYICAMLETQAWLSGKDLVSKLINKDASGEEYVLEEFNELKTTFVQYIYFELNKKIKQNPDDLFIQDPKLLESKFEEYKQSAHEKMTSLMFKLDELTTFYDGHIPDKLKMRGMRFYAASDVLKKEKLKKL